MTTRAVTKRPAFSVRLLAALTATTASLWWFPSAAHALCPNCLGQNATWTATLKLVGVFLLIPPAVFFFVARLIRRLDRADP
jgi:hypothetical protein